MWQKRSTGLVYFPYTEKVAAYIQRSAKFWTWQTENFPYIQFRHYFLEKEGFWACRHMILYIRAEKNCICPKWGSRTNLRPPHLAASQEKSHQSERLSRSFHPQEIAPAGQAFLQSPQRMHSGSLEFFTGSQFILQALAQAPQLTHLSGSVRYRKTEMGLNTE